VRPPYPSLSSPFTIAAALALGHTRDELRQAVRVGRLVSLRRGVLVAAEARRVAEQHDTTLHAQDIAALALAMPRRSLVAVGASATRIHGLPLRRSPPDELAVCVNDRRRTCGTHRDGYYLRVARLPEHHVETRHGVLVTTPARTVLDVAAHHGFDNGVVATDAAYHARLITPSLLRLTAEDLENRPGIETARECLAFADPAAESVLESISRLAMREIGIPMPETQVVLYDDGCIEIRVDFFWRRLRLVGEADGLKKYTLNGRQPLDALRDERERERILRDQDFDIVRWDWRIANNPRLLAARLKPALARAEARIGRTG